RHTRFSRDWSSDVCSSDLWIGWQPRKGPLVLGAGRIDAFRLPAEVTGGPRRSAPAVEAGAPTASGMIPSEPNLSGDNNNEIEPTGSGCRRSRCSVHGSGRPPRHG